MDFLKRDFYYVCRKQAMETELLKSKNEMMTLNNQLLEAVQSRLELSIELEAWKVCSNKQYLLQNVYFAL